MENCLPDESPPIGEQHGGVSLATDFYVCLLQLEPALIAKSSLLLDVKPWDDETDMAKLEECVRSIEMDGLVWGQCKRTAHSTGTITSNPVPHHTPH